MSGAAVHALFSPPSGAETKIERQRMQPNEKKKVGSLYVITIICS